MTLPQKKNVYWDNIVNPPVPVSNPGTGFLEMGRFLFKTPINFL